ncbi:hypothetical protein CPB86DRAFT_753844 [Serendipita vermifera]|nr:hypothetical protein CPB86DRAFT_753844 [Serendipita vermifera]
MSNDLRRRYQRDTEGSSSTLGSSDAESYHHTGLVQASMQDGTTANGSILDSIIQYLLLCILGTFKVMFRLIKKPIKFIIYLVLFMFILNFIAPFIGSLFISTVAPVCYSSVLSRTGWCQGLLWSVSKGRYDKPNFDELVKIQMEFDNILDNVGLGAHLGMGMKKSEVAVRDLSAAVSVSDLRSKRQLESSLDELASSMKQVVPLFGKLDAAMEGTADYIIIVDDLAIKTLQSAKDVRATKDEKASTSLVLRALWPFNSPSIADVEILDAFVYAATTLEHDVARLIELSTGVSQRLDTIEEQLDTINRIVYKEKRYNKDKNATLVGPLCHIHLSSLRKLAELWSMLGGNKAKLAMFKSNFALLADLQRYHKTAVEQVGSIAVHLRDLSDHLGQLQGGVRTTVGSSVSDHKGRRKTTSLEANIEMLHKGITRLTSSRGKAKQRKEHLLQRIVDDKQYLELPGM